MADAKIVISATDKSRAAFESAKGNIKSLSDTAATLPARFGTIGVAVAAAFSAVSIKGAVDVLDTLDDLSEKTGIAVEQLSALRYAGEVTGTPLESIAAGVKKLAVNMTEAAAGGKEQVAAFRAVNVEIKNADGTLRSQDAVLLDLADRFASYEDGAAKAALAQKIFGKAGAEMIPLLNQGSEGIKRLTDEGRALGVVYGPEAAKNAAAFNDNLKKLELAAEAAKVQIGNELVPALTRLTNEFLEGRKAFGSYWSAFVELGLKTNPFASTEENARSANEQVQRLTQKIQELETRKAGGTSNIALARIDSQLKGARADLETALQRKQYFEALLKQDQPAEVPAPKQQPKGQAPVVADPSSESDRKRAAADAARELKEQAKLLAELHGLSGTFAEDWDRLNTRYNAGKLSLEQLTEEQRKLLEQQPFMRKKLQDEKELNDARAKAIELEDKYIASLAADNEALAKSNLSIQQHNEEIGLTGQQLQALSLARVDAAIAAERENLARAKSMDGNEQEIAQIEQRISLLQRRRDLTSEGQQKTASADVAGEVKGDLKNAIQAALQDSQNPVKAFAESLANAVSSRLSAKVADSLASSITSMGSQPGSGSGGGSGGGFMSFISSLFSADGGGYTGDASRSGGLDGKGGFLAVLHPQETVLDHTKGQSAPTGAQSVVINQYLTVGDVASMQQVQEQLRMSERRMIAGLQRQSVYGS
jgi:hypothetical protein